MASIVYTVILIVSFLFLIWKKDDTESYFPLKVIGYLVLGSIAFKLNHISLPLGFVVYLLFFRPKLNIRIKEIAALLGVFAFILVYWIMPYVTHKWESRPINLEHKLGSVYTMNFQDEIKLVEQKLNLDNNSLKLEDFEVDYTEDGSMTDLRWQLLGQNGNSYNHYQIKYEFNKNKYRIIYSQSDTWLQYNRLIDANYFFENLNVIDIKAITHAKGHFSSYVIRSDGEQTSYAVNNHTHYVVLNGKIKLLNDIQLPVETYYISTFALKKTGEKRDQHGHITQMSFEGTQTSDYLFGLNFDEK